MNKINDDFDVIEDVKDGEYRKDQQGNKQGDPSSPEPLNDAEILGVEPEGFEEFLNRKVTFLTGEMWGARDRRNTQDGDWIPVELPLAQWIGGGEKSANTPTWGFSRHPVGKDKAGPAIVLGSSVDGARKAKAMDTMYAMGIDVDSGAQLDDVLDILEEKKIFCLVYTSFNHGKRGIELKRDEVLRKLQISSDPTNNQIRQFLREFDKNRYEETFIAECSIKEQKHQTADGVKIVLDTPPLEKFRLIFPLAEAVKLIDLADTQTAALALWEDKITGLARNVLGVHFDTACTDPSRLFFTARHPKSSDNWCCAIVQGEPIRFDEIEPFKKSVYTSTRDDNPFAVAGGGDDERPPMALTPSGSSLNEWHTRFKDRFMIADLIETLCPDKVRIAGGEAQGHIHTECPFEHEHTSEGGTATMAINCLDSPNEYWTWFCHHDACQGRHKLQFLEEALRQGWFDEDALWDLSQGFVLEPADEDRPEIPPEFEQIDRWLPRSYAVRGNTIYLKKDEHDLPLCQLFNVIGRAANEDGQSGAGVIIQFANRNGVSVEVTIDRKDLMKDGGGDVLDKLSDADMHIYVREKRGKGYLLDLLHSITPDRLVTTNRRPGWARDRAGEITGSSAQQANLSPQRARYPDDCTVMRPLTIPSPWEAWRGGRELLTQRPRTSTGLLVSLLVSLAPSWGCWVCGPVASI